MLEVGNVGQATAELDAYLELVPNSKMAQSLRDQISEPIETYFPTDGFPVTLASGESLSTLSKKYLGDALKFYALARYNELGNPSQVSAGQEILIPATKMAIEVRDRPAEPEAPVELAKPAPTPDITPMTEEQALAGWEKVNQAIADGNGTTAVDTLDGMTITNKDEATTAASIYIEQSRSLAGSDKSTAAALATKAGTLLLNVADDASGAMAALTTAIKLNPSSTTAQEQLVSAEAAVSDTEYRAGLEDYNKQDLDAAIIHWDNVLAINPDHTNAQLYKSQANDLKAKLSSM